MDKSKYLVILASLTILVTSCRAKFEPSGYASTEGLASPGEETKIELEDGAAISIPEDSINSDISVLVERNPTKSANLQPLPEGFIQVGDFYNFEITQGELLGPVDLTLPFDENLITEEDGYLLVAIPAESGWEFLPVEENGADNSVTIFTSKLGDPLIAWHFAPYIKEKLCETPISLSVVSMGKQFQIIGKLTPAKSSQGHDMSGIEVNLQLNGRFGKPGHEWVVTTNSEGYFSVMMDPQEVPAIRPRSEINANLVTASAVCENWAGYKFTTYGSTTFYYDPDTSQQSPTREPESQDSSQNIIPPQSPTDKIAIPNVVGMTFEDAQQTLENLGFKTLWIDGVSSQELGIIYQQQPAAGSKFVPHRTTVVLYRTIKKANYSVDDINGNPVWINIIDGSRKTVNSATILYTSNKEDGTLLLIIPPADSGLIYKFYYLDNAALGMAPRDESLPPLMRSSLINIELDGIEKASAIQEFEAPQSLIEDFFASANWEMQYGSSRNLCELLSPSSSQISVASISPGTDMAVINTLSLNAAAAHIIHGDTSLASNGFSTHFFSYCTASTGILSESTSLAGVLNKRLGFSMILINTEIPHVMTGRILDNDTGNPLQGAAITDNGFQTMSLEDGIFYTPSFGGSILTIELGGYNPYTPILIFVPDPNDPYSNVIYNMGDTYLTRIMVASNPTPIPSTDPALTGPALIGPALTGPTLYADKNYLCREGPGTGYGHAVDILEGETYRIIGLSSNGWYLLEINNPNTSHTSCWIGGGVVSGDISSLPLTEVTSTSGEDSEEQNGTVHCWIDLDDMEDNYNIYTCSCWEISEVGYGNRFTVNGRAAWIYYRNDMNHYFYDDEARRDCPGDFP